MKNIIEDSILSGLADAIREKLGVSDTMLPSEMGGKIGEIPAGSGVYAWKRTDSSGNFIEYVVNDDEAAYPADGSVHTDGYVYEKVKDEVLLYVWNKLEKKTTNTTVTDTLTGTFDSTDSRNIHLTTTGKIAPSSITKNDLSGLTFYQPEPWGNGVTRIELTSSGTFNNYNSSGALNNTGSHTYTLSGSTVTLNSYHNEYKGVTGTKTITRTTTNTTTTNIGEVTSEDRNAYPDTINTQHTDGYYYEYVGTK